MAKKKLIGNQENLPEEKKQFRHRKDGSKKSVLIHILGRNDCPKCWQEKENHFTDRNEVWKTISN